MRFNVDQPIAAAVARVEEALVDPRFYKFYGDIQALDRESDLLAGVDQSSEVPMRGTGAMERRTVRRREIAVAVLVTAVFVATSTGFTLRSEQSSRDSVSNVDGARSASSTHRALPTKGIGVIRLGERLPVNFNPAMTLEPSVRESSTDYQKGGISGTAQ